MYAETGLYGGGEGLFYTHKFVGHTPLIQKAPVPPLSKAAYTPEKVM